MKVPISPRPEEVFLFRFKGGWWLTVYFSQYYLVHDCKNNKGSLLGRWPIAAIDCCSCKVQTPYDVIEQAIILENILK
jgi:hypothetical protein